MTNSNEILDGVHRLDIEDRPLLRLQICQALAEAKRRGLLQEEIDGSLHVESDYVPEARDLVKIVLQAFAEDHHLNSESIRSRFWFDKISPGESKSYSISSAKQPAATIIVNLNAPPHSGDLLLHTCDACIRTPCIAGAATAFPGNVTQEITANCASEDRIWLVINILCAEREAMAA